jgi:hypothetical protein
MAKALKNVFKTYMRVCIEEHIAHSPRGDG